jgi:hypothetical protein
MCLIGKGLKRWGITGGSGMSGGNAGVSGEREETLETMEPTGGSGASGWQVGSTVSGRKEREGVTVRGR